MGFPDYIKKNQMHLILNATVAEKMAISYFESNKIKFKFQKIIRCGKQYYVADFYFPKAKTILEIDGDYHHTGEQAIQDAKRTKELESVGYKVVRITNDDVYNENYPIFII